MDRAYGDATLALFPYRPELDQSGALLRSLGAGVPAVAYDVGGLGDPIRDFGAGRVVPAGDVAGMAAAVRELLDDPDALSRRAPEPGGRATRSPGTRPPSPTSTSTGSSCEALRTSVRRQLALEREQAGLIRDCVEAERAYVRAPREDAEERYGDYQDLVETGTELLAELRDNYAATLEETTAAEYETAFDAVVLKHLPRFALELEDT